jgi:hypothetical protein
MQANAAAYILSTYSTAYNGNVALMATAYNGGSGVADLAQSYVSSGIPTMDAIQMAAANYTSSEYPNGISTAKQNQIYNYAQKVSTGAVSGGQSNLGLQVANTEGVDDSNAPAAVTVEGSTQAITQSDLTPSLIITEGTDATPWFSDPAILQVNGATKAVAAPVTFAIYYDLNNSPLPISIKLNASLQTVERSLHHVVNRQATRTGFLLTLWGMQPDQITGSGNTGVFMNQLGLTDLLSLSGTPSAIEQSVLAAFSSKSMEAALTSDGMFRVAAKDAFIEFLFTFKNNGIVWFQNPNYTGYTSEQMQLGPNAWSPQTGTSSFQNQGRRNDVMTRGGVAMYYRNSVYYGYFKSFNWTEDAEKPFSWNFTFVFCVERTITCVNRPDLSQWDALS